MRVAAWHNDGSISVVKCEDIPSYRPHTSVVTSYYFEDKYDDVYLEAIPGYLLIDGIAHYQQTPHPGIYCYPNTSFLSTARGCYSRHISNAGITMFRHPDLTRWRKVTSSDVDVRHIKIEHMAIESDKLVAYGASNGYYAKCVIPSPYPDYGLMLAVVFLQTKRKLKICVLYEPGYVYNITDTGRHGMLSNVFNDNISQRSILLRGKVVEIGILEDVVIREEGGGIARYGGRLISHSNMIPVVDIRGRMTKSAR